MVLFKSELALEIKDCFLVFFFYCMLVATKEFIPAVVTVNQNKELLKLLELNTISKQLDRKS